MFNDLAAFGGQNGFRMKLYAIEFLFRIFHCCNRTAGRMCRNRKAFRHSCDGQSVECGANISLYNSNSQTFSDSTNLPPQGTGYLQLMLMVPKGWQQLSVTYMPTFAADKTMTFVMTAADVTRA